MTSIRRVPINKQKIFIIIDNQILFENSLFSLFIRIQLFGSILRVCYLDGSKMDEIVSSFFGNSESILPLAERTKALGKYSLAVDAIDG